MLFKDLGLSAELLSAVEKKGYEEATPVQQQAIPLILEGKDVLAGAVGGAKIPGHLLLVGIQIKPRARRNLNLGLPFFAHCALGRPLAKVKLVTVVRHPVDRFVSALRYFDQVRALSLLNP